MGSLARSVAPSLTAGVLLACSSSSPRGGDATVHVPPPPPDAVTPAPPAQQACAALRALQRSALTSALEAARKGQAAPESDGDPLPEPVVVERLAKETARCLSSGRGAWAVVVERLSPMPWTGWSGVQVLLSIAYADATGVRGRMTPFASVADGGLSPEDGNYYFSVVDEAEVQTLSTYDYDGDGEAELSVVFAGDYHEGESWSWGHVYAAADGRPRAYAPAARVAFSKVEDIDADGRPDLVGSGPYDAVHENCCSGFTSRLEGPPLVGHARADGTFALDDAVAMTFAKRGCPSPPREIVAGGADWSAPAVHEAVVCARLWGVDGPTILASIDDAFAKLPKKKSADGFGDCDTQNCVSPGEIRRQAAAWVAITPPLTLR